MAEHVTIQCCVCAEPVCFTRDRHARLRETGENFQCSRGHVQYFTESENTRLRAEIERLKADRDWWRERAERYRDSAALSERRRRAQKAATSRLRAERDGSDVQ